VGGPVTITAASTDGSTTIQGQFTIQVTSF
jgi:hypothetical protein